MQSLHNCKSVELTKKSAFVKLFCILLTGELRKKSFRGWKFACKQLMRLICIARGSGLIEWESEIKSLFWWASRKLSWACKSKSTSATFLLANARVRAALGQKGYGEKTASKDGVEEKDLQIANLSQSARPSNLNPSLSLQIAFNELQVAVTLSPASIKSRGESKNDCAISFSGNLINSD